MVIGTNADNITSRGRLICSQTETVAIGPYESSPDEQLLGGE